MIHFSALDGFEREKDGVIVIEVVRRVKRPLHRRLQYSSAG
jgi:hypothetical protein